MVREKWRVLSELRDCCLFLFLKIKMHIHFVLKQNGDEKESV